MISRFGWLIICAILTACGGGGGSNSGLDSDGNMRTDQSNVDRRDVFERLESMDDMLPEVGVAHAYRRRIFIGAFNEAQVNECTNEQRDRDGDELRQIATPSSITDNRFCLNDTNSGDEICYNLGERSILEEAVDRENSETLFFDNLVLYNSFGSVSFLNSDSTRQNLRGFIVKAINPTSCRNDPPANYLPSDINGDWDVLVYQKDGDAFEIFQKTEFTCDIDAAECRGQNIDISQLSDEFADDEDDFGELYYEGSGRTADAFYRSAYGVVSFDKSILAMSLCPDNNFDKDKIDFCAFIIATRK